MTFIYTWNSPYLTLSSRSRTFSLYTILYIFYELCSLVSHDMINTTYGRWGVLVVFLIRHIIRLLLTTKIIILIQHTPAYSTGVQCLTRPSRRPRTTDHVIKNIDSRVYVGNAHRREYPQAGMPTAWNAHHLIRQWVFPH